MRAISRFVRTTILGGILFLTPIVVIWLILSKAYDVAGRVLQPLTALIPESLSSRTTTHRGPRSPVDRARLLPRRALRPDGLGAEDRPRTRIVCSLQGPGLRIYEAGRRERARRRRDGAFVLANLGGACIGVQTDVLGEDLVTVFIPNSPNP
jgi:hypothetical protein